MQMPGDGDRDMRETAPERIRRFISQRGRMEGREPPDEEGIWKSAWLPQSMSGESAPKATSASINTAI